MQRMTRKDWIDVAAILDTHILNDYGKDAFTKARVQQLLPKIRSHYAGKRLI